MANRENQTPPEQEAYIKGLESYLATIKSGGSDSKAQSSFKREANQNERLRDNARNTSTSRNKAKQR